MGIVQAIFLFLRAFILGRAATAVENLALRQQIAVFKQSGKRPKLRPHDRVFWVLLSRLWPNWRSTLAIVQPATVIRWHRMGFKLYWRWKSRAGKPGRPPIERKIRDLIRRMSRENPTWGAPRIVSELALLGHDVAEATVARVHDAAKKAAVADLADISGQSCARRSIRRECLDHVIVLKERHLHRILSEYFDYYHNSRCHLSLDRNSPTPRNVEPPSLGEVVSIPQAGGLHHRYTRCAA